MFMTSGRTFQVAPKPAQGAGPQQIEAESALASFEKIGNRQVIVPAANGADDPKALRGTQTWNGRVDIV
jgi:hypothetical protein